MFLVGGDDCHSHHYWTWAVKVQANLHPSQEGGAEYYVVILDVHDIEVFFDIAIA
jgi:hypothetical protein